MAVIQGILGFFLVLFIPGYAITLVLYPGPDELSTFRRMAFSVVFSMGAVILIVLFIDEVLAVNTTPLNIAGAIIIFSLFATIVWRAELILKKMISKHTTGDGDRPGDPRFVRSRHRSPSDSGDREDWETRIWKGIKK